MMAWVTETLAASQVTALTLPAVALLLCLQGFFMSKGRNAIPFLACCYGASTCNSGVMNRASGKISGGIQKMPTPQAEDCRHKHCQKCKLTTNGLLQTVTLDQYVRTGGSTHNSPGVPPQGAVARALTSKKGSHCLAASRKVAAPATEGCL